MTKIHWACWLCSLVLAFMVRALTIPADLDGPALFIVCFILGWGSARIGYLVAELIISRRALSRRAHHLQKKRPAQRD